MTRKELMSRIKSRGNKSTELTFARLLRRHKCTGWRRHVKALGIRPDFVFRKNRIAVFVDGCFWHWCIQHVRVEKLSVYWRTKIIGNWMRDIVQTQKLKNGGWHVIRVWEHDLKGV